MSDVIGGTVIQRSFVGREAANILHVASVPVAELGAENGSAEDIIAEVLGIPRTTILDDQAYRRLVDTLRHYPPDFFFPFWRPPTDRYFRSLYESIQGPDSPTELFGDFLATAGASGIASNFPQSWPLFLDPDLLKTENINQNALAIGMHCIGSRILRSNETKQFIEGVYSYDIPLGQSPSVKGDSLLRLLETSRKYCIAPLALGGTQGISQLAQGNYVAAMLTTGTASAMTLVLIGTVSVGALIVQRVAQTRAKAITESNKTDDDGTQTPRRATTPRKRGRTG
jgi:hypothetical protein